MAEHTKQNTPAEGAGEESPHRLEQQRRDNRDAISALGLRPYGGRVDGLISLGEAAARYDEAADAKWNELQAARKEAQKQGDSADAAAPHEADPRPRAMVAGRIMLKRPTGKLVWMNLRDASGDLQIAVSKRDVAEPGFELAGTVDLGDIVIAEGPLVKTRTGEITIWADSLSMGAKSLAPPPEKWSGLQDVEQRYRRRYVDLYVNPETMNVFQMRSRLISHLRRYLDERGFTEVETPILQTQAGGAAARPFITHMNALRIDLYMRIAPELFLKRLLVGGMPRVYEINRNFRNEGLDKQHNPEFTMLELYDAFGDVQRVMDLTEGLIRSAAHFVAGTSTGDVKLAFGELMVDYGSAFDRITYADLFERALGFSMDDEARVRAEADSRGLTKKYTKHLEEEGRSSGEAGAKSIDPLLLVNELFEAVAEPSIDPAKPTWIMQYPAALSPLTRPNPDNPKVADRSDLFIGHMEVGPHYTELNDPDVQAAKFREQLSGIDDEEQTFRTFDEDFVNALKVGMPPAGGLGLGVDRLCMLLLNQRTIRDVILFPMMRPSGG